MLMDLLPKYLTKGGCTEIYTLDWTGGHYIEWEKAIIKEFRNT